MMRILLLVPDYLPAFRVDVAVLFGKYLPREGVTTDIVGRSLPGIEERAQGFASARRSPAAGGRIAREWAYLRLVVGVLLDARRRMCDVIIVRDMVSIGLVAVLIARLRGIPCVFWMSYLMSESRCLNARADGAWRSNLRATLVWLKGFGEAILLKRVVLPICRHVFVQSDAMAIHVAGIGVAPHRMTTVPMGVDTEVVHPQRVLARRLPGWADVPVVAYLGTLENSRRPEVLLEMIHIVRKNHPTARLLMIGSAGSDGATDSFRACVAKVGLGDAVHITGWLPIEQAWELLRAADVSVAFIPRSEIFDTNSPTKLIESLALGTPTVASDNPDQADVLERTGAGWLVRSDADSLASTVVALLNDPTKASTCAANGPAAIDAIRSYRVLSRVVAARLFALKG
jgi:glycosyltransferase involved in cell wall biosynthesis